MPKVGGKRKKKRTHKEHTEENRIQMESPKSFIISRGNPLTSERKLVKDLRKLFYPFTGMKLEDNLKVPVKQYIKAAQAYQMNYLVMVVKKTNLYLKILKLQTRTTILFRIVNYATRTLLNSKIKDFKQFQNSFTAPLLIMSGFGECERGSQLQRAAKLLKEMFPPLDQQSRTKIRRVVSISFCSQRNCIYVRNYAFKRRREIKQAKFQELVSQKKGSKDLSEFSSFKQFINSKQESQSDRGQSKVFELGQLGPRLKLKLIRVQQ